MADLEDRLRDVLHEQAAGVVPPSTPADLAGQVRRRRRRYRATRIAAAAATVGVVVGGVVLIGVPEIASRHRGQPAQVTISTEDVLRVCSRPPTSSRSMNQTVDVWFDGTRAYYDGPTRVRAGATITFHVTGQVKGTAVATADLPDSVTCEQMYYYAATGKFSQPPDYLTGINWQIGDLTTTFIPGRHVVVLGIGPDDKETAALAAVIEAS